MNPTEIADALDALAKAPFVPAEFGFAFADATDNAKATIAKLRSTTNKSDHIFRNGTARCGNPADAAGSRFISR